MKQNTQPASAPGLARQPRARVRARLLAEENARLRAALASFPEYAARNIQLPSSDWIGQVIAWREETRRTLAQ